MFNIDNCKKEMDSTVSALEMEHKNIRTGRVSPDILKNILVDSYGSKMPLTQLSNINNIDNMTLNVNVWDASLVKTIEKNIIIGIFLSLAKLIAVVSITFISLLK